MTYEKELKTLHKEYNNGYLTYDQLVKAKQALDKQHNKK